MAASKKSTNQAKGTSRPANGGKPLPRDSRTLQRVFDALHRFSSQLEEDAARALDAARNRRLAPLRSIEQTGIFLLQRYAANYSGESNTPSVRKPAGFSVTADLAIGLGFIDGDALSACIDRLAGTAAALAPYEGKPFRRRAIVVGTLKERSLARKKLRDKAARSPETQAERAGLDALDHELSRLVSLLRGTASRFASGLVSQPARGKAKRGKEDASAMTPPTVASRLGVSPDKVRAWIKNGELKATNAAKKQGGVPRWSITADALADFQKKRQAQQPVAKTRKPRRKQQPDVTEFFT